MPLVAVTHAQPAPSDPPGQFTITAMGQVVLDSGRIEQTGDAYWSMGVVTEPMPFDTPAAQIRATVTAALVAAVNAETLPDGTRLLPDGVTVSADDLLFTYTYERG